MKRENQLGQLIVDLEEMVSLLEQDPACCWTQKFATDLAAARSIADSPFDQDAYAALSASIRSVYAGMGSFNDYMPGRYDPATGRYVLFPWSERLDQLTTCVFDRALALVASVSEQN